MRKSILIVIIIMVVLLAMSCSPSKVHGSAFDRIVDTYRQSGDTLKLRAAEYLRAFSRYHYGIKRSIPSEISGSLFLDIEKGDSVFKHYLDSMGYRVEYGEPVYDYETVTDSFLLDNIEMAFDSWQRPWARDLTFEEFCKYMSGHDDIWYATNIEIVDYMTAARGLSLVPDFNVFALNSVAFHEWVGIVGYRVFR